jgi:hypothetical protein
VRSAALSASQHSTTEANASFTSNASMTSIDRPARQHLRVAGMIAVSKYTGSSPTTDIVCSRERGRQPRAVAISLVVTSRVAEPSLTRLEMPGVTFPSISPKRSVRSASANAGRRPANASTMDPGLMGLVGLELSDAGECHDEAGAETARSGQTPPTELDHRQVQMDAEQEQIPAFARAEADRLREQALEAAIARRAEAQAEAERILDEAKTSGRGLEFGGRSEDDICSLLWRFVSSGG